MIPDLENPQPLYFRYCLRRSILSLPGTLLRSVLDFSLLHTLLFLGPLSAGTLGDWYTFLQS